MYKIPATDSWQWNLFYNSYSPEDYRHRIPSRAPRYSDRHITSVGNEITTCCPLFPECAQLHGLAYLKSGIRTAFDYHPQLCIARLEIPTPIFYSIQDTDCVFIFSTLHHTFLCKNHAFVKSACHSVTVCHCVWLYTPILHIDISTVVLSLHSLSSQPPQAPLSNSWFHTFVCFTHMKLLHNCIYNIGTNVLRSCSHAIEFIEKWQNFLKKKKRFLNCPCHKIVQRT